MHQHLAVQTFTIAYFLGLLKQQPQAAKHRSWRRIVLNHCSYVFKEPAVSVGFKSGELAKSFSGQL